MSVKFGVLAPQGWMMDLEDIEDPVDKYEAMTRVAVEAEKLGFDSVWLYDHLHTYPTPALETTFECWTSTAALARDTSRIRIGQMVTCTSFRNPALLAKMASTVDVLSHGRLNFGIGAGWYEHEYLAYGYPYPVDGERLKMLGEALQVIRGMWREPYATFEGKYYQVSGAINEPKGVQKPHIPIWIGGSGEQVTLKLVAMYGDACNLHGKNPARYQHKLDVLRRHCDIVGRDYSTIIKSGFVMTVPVRPGQDPEYLTRNILEGDSFEVFSKRAAMGSAQQIIDAYAGLVDIGVDYIIAADVPGIAHLDALRMIGEEVLPAFR
ncbi:MAG: LLM class F420-dependent oxidoreductase [Chloroflexia bacterium]